jgi:hypothetical protein
MSKRTSIYIGPALQALFDQHPPNEDQGRSRSALINAVADRYQEAIRRSTPTLQLGEWMLICEALNGACLVDVFYVRTAATFIEDAINLDGLAEKWGVDAVAILEKTMTFNFCELLALVDAAERFWSYTAAEGESYDDIIKAIVGENHVIVDSVST